MPCEELIEKHIKEMAVTPRDPERINEFCDMLKKTWHKVPDWRFGQLMFNFFGDVYAKSKKDIFYIEDDVVNYPT